MKNLFKRAFLRLASNSLSSTKKTYWTGWMSSWRSAKGKPTATATGGIRGPCMCPAMEWTPPLWPGATAPPNPGRPAPVSCRRRGLVAQPRGNRLVHRLRLADPAVRHPDGISHRGKGLHPCAMRTWRVWSTMERCRTPARLPPNGTTGHSAPPGCRHSVKIVQAMANGIAVATTTKGGHGLGLDNGEGIALDHPDGFADSISEIVRHPDRLGQLGEQGMDVARTRFDGRVIARNPHGILRRLHSTLTAGLDDLPRPSSRRMWKETDE